MILPPPSVDTLIKGVPDQEEVRRRLDAPCRSLSEFDDLQVTLTKLRDLLDSTAGYLDQVVVRACSIFHLFFVICSCIGLNMWGWHQPVHIISSVPLPFHHSHVSLSAGG